MTACFACAYAFLCARSHPVAALIFAFAFLFVSVAPVYMVQIGPDFFNLRDRPVRLLLLVLQGSRRAAAPIAPRRVADALAAGAALRRRSPRCCWASRRSRSRRNVAADRAAAGVGGAAPAVARGRQDRRRVFGVVVVALFALNIAVTGEWNYQGGERKTFYSARRHVDGGFPFQNDDQHVRHGRPRPRRRRRADRRAGHPRRAGRRLPPQPRLLLRRPAHRLRRLLLPGHDGDPAVPGRRRAIARCGSG